MSKKNVDDYLMEGIHGKRRPNESERAYFLGTLRERIVIALTKGQVMSDKSLAKLEEAMKEHPEATLLINGTISYRFLKAEKDLANAYNIAYTVITNEEVETDIGAVLTYDFAIDQESIFVEDEVVSNQPEPVQKGSFLDKIKRFFSPNP
ncbi:YueI family protein [Lentibacillus saliphilus]|uniref:YueI family protein n=1 Tax=Lentibacillus saliphilus TaxID=2737028 RepID=UPI001C2F1B50|nr:YueI family protein [Lentibacillus saliphilus]